MSISKILGNFSKMNVLVVGDICLDRWCTYDPATREPSRETGIPRIGVISYVPTAGACGTIANNLADLGVGKVAVMGVIGEDTHGDELFRALGVRDIGVDLVIRSSEVQTFTYVKHINKETGIEDLPRVDYINTTPLPAKLDSKLVKCFESYAPMFDAVLICDQAETSSGGVITDAMQEAINRFAASHPNKIVWVDSRRRAEFFRHCYLKPNEDEARETATRLTGQENFEPLAAALQLRALVVTEGERGAKVVDAAGMRQLKTISVSNPVDICGAGDSFSAGAATALAAGATIDEAVHLGNLVASVTIMKRGTGTATQAEVLAAAATVGIS
ncbi:bifunctional heptose 7-phosphate kinase/heptose 1-phosphate adenyltransferase [Bryobacter aggregatus]|uniref:bifunctional heptose 7-phosphate kinase/heptose 1-phosphate adenyltransferase n=1 Tax=Bryobacter aggregatus TaxID=360054 RepID=UPI0004E247B3|nr:PfkB family carbohydrate kinase [Bryobacter aggregatus]